MVFAFVSVSSSFTASFFMSFFVTEMSIHNHVRSGMLQFPGNASAMCFESSCTSALLSHVDLCFQMLGTSLCKMGCYYCCCWLCQFRFNVTLGAGLGAANLSKSTRSASWAVTRSMQSSFNLTQYTACGLRFHLVSHGAFSRNCEIEMRLFLCWVLSKRIPWS